MKFYIKTNKLGGIVDISDDSLFGGIEIESEKDLIQYLVDGLCTENGFPKYKLENGEIVERTFEEIEQEFIPPTTEDRLSALEAAMLDMIIGGMSK
ncbi:MAG: hypothetical protein IJD14_04905 [Christensenellaceae bacterium]|nr:hypothetical protein [Christensenellaceae bacterium]